MMERMKKSPNTKLTVFFALNHICNLAQTLLYRDIYNHYMWDETKWTWKRRIRDQADGLLSQIGRIYSIHPTQVEIYCLWFLLNYVKGPLGYRDVKQVYGVQ